MVTDNGFIQIFLDPDGRKEKIREDLERLAATKGSSLDPNPSLLEEVAGLVEYPVVLMGSVDADFMTLPREVLATTMRVNQKYFLCRYPDGTPAPHFFPGPPGDRHRFGFRLLPRFTGRNGLQSRHLRRTWE